MQFTKSARCLLVAAGLAAASMTSTASAQTAFTYQGVLEEGGSPVTGLENIRFRIYDAPSGGSLLGETTQNVDVADGVFSTPLNFGPLNTIDPSSAWLEIAVSTGPGTFETLGRQQLTAAPFAVNTRGLNVDGSGRVSIGTDDHFDRLHIAGNNARILTEATSGTFSGIRSRLGAYEYFTGIDTFGLAEPVWHVFDNRTVQRRLTLDPSGNFGIGVDEPSARLDVAGTAKINGLDVAGTATIDDNVGIGGSSGGARLRVTGAGGGRFDVFNGSSSGGRQLLGGFFGDNAGPFARFQRIQGGNYADVGLSSIGDFDLSINDSSHITVKPNGRVGVGTNNPQFPVTIEGDASGGSLGVRSTTGGSGYHLDFNGGSLSIVESGDKIRATFLDDDRLAIGSNFGFTNVGVNINLPFTFGLLLEQGDAGKPGGGSWANTSDVRLKKNIEDLDGALDTLLSLRGVTYEYKDPEAIGELSGTRTGFIAQEAEEVIPDWVWDAEDGYKRMTIRGFEAMAVEAFREQQEQIAALEAKIESMQAQRSMTGASMVWPVLLGGGLLGGFVVARRRTAKA